jgi:hypothetical protein
MKKFLCGLFVGILIMVSVPAFGAVGQQITVAINSIKVIVNGQEMTADRFVYKDRTYVQLKELTDMLGGELQWDKENNAAIATIGLDKPEEVNPLPLKDIEESKPVTEPQAEPRNEPKTVEAPPVRNQEPPQESGGGEQPQEPEQPDEPEPPEEPEPPKTRTTTLVYDGAKCSCGTTGFLLNRRTIQEGGQEYDVCDAKCHNPRCRFFDQVIGEVRWLVEYK